MKNTARNPHVKQAAMASAVALAVWQMSQIGQAHAQEAAPAPAQAAVQSVMVTGSLIRHAADEGATPLITVKAAELEARGNTELKDLVLEQPQSLSLGTNTGAAGPVTNLRGLGPMRTLTLLNGRRLANEPLQDQYVSVNVIPRMALDRVDTLSGGAASIYGADAIGGVQNYWTKRGYKGASVKAEYASPEMSGGGQTRSLGAIAGWGELGKDGWNAYIAVDYQEKTPLFQNDRPGQHDPAILRGLGLGITPDSRNPSPTANFGFTRAANSNYNPTFASGCLAPYSVPVLGNASANTPPVYAPGCLRDPLFWTAVTDGSKITNVSGRASWNLSGGHRIDLDLLHAGFTVQKFRGMQVPGSTQPFTTYALAPSSRFYPGKGITPAVQVVGSNTGSNTPAMYIDPARTPGTVSNLNMNNRTLYFQWGPGELGPAYRNDEQTNDRIVLSAEGDVAGWDYRAGLNYGRSKRDTRAGSGYILYSKAQAGFDQGILNPFGLQDAAGLAYLQDIQASDYTYRLNKAFNQSADITLSKPVWTLGGGDLTVAVSGELRKDSAQTFNAPLDYVLKRANGSYNIDASGNVVQSDLIGETPQGVAKKIHRNIASLSMEIDAPITSTFLLNGAVRADRYQDLKTTTVNPKLAARWLPPIKDLVIRGSVSTGFRAPSIMDIQNPTPEVRTQTMDDPVLCPSSQPTVAGTGTPVAGRSADVVCNVLTTYWTKSPNNQFLKPEKSRGFSFGFGYEPIKNMSITLDYWGIGLKDVLGAVSIAEIQQNPVKYADLILRNADGTIDHIVASQANRGQTRIRGADVAAGYRFPTTSIGTFDARVDGTWYHKYEFQGEKDGVWLQNVGVITNDGRYGSAGPNSGLAGMPQINPRWKHTASLTYTTGPWGATLSQRYQRGVTDLTPRAGSTLTEVDSYSQFNVNVRYKGIKNTTISLGVNNVTEEWPPLTSNSIYSGGYVTSMADMLGRVYRLSVEYKF